MLNAPTQKVMIIGAGIAGVTAAYYLTKAGISVKVLEESGRVSGRMTTDAVNGCLVDCGAQFLSSEYHLLPSLAAEVGGGFSPASGFWPCVSTFMRLRRKTFVEMDLDHPAGASTPSRRMERGAASART